MIEISEGLAILLRPLKGQPCISASVGEWKSLALWFGGKPPIQVATGLDRGEYRIGTYSSNWKIYDQDGSVLCDAQKSTANEIKIKLEDLHIGLFKALAPTTSGGIALLTEDNFVIEFTSQDLDDEMFHVFFPNDVYVGYSQEEGWRHGSSKEPWDGGSPI